MPLIFERHTEKTQLIFQNMDYSAGIGTFLTKR